jgi:hypothetical protein
MFTEWVRNSKALQQVIADVSFIMVKPDAHEDDLLACHEKSPQITQIYTDYKKNIKKSA